jgi:glycosyltransferase involved in cell wall biosynthesis
LHATGEVGRTVLVYTSGVLPPSETFVADQARALTRWNPVLVGRQRERPSLDVDDIIADEMRDFPVPSRLRAVPAKVTRRVPLIRTVADRVRPHLLHAHFLTGGFDVMSTLRPLPCPLIVTAHGFDATWAGSPPETWRPDQWWHGLLRRRLLRSPVQFIAVSRFIESELVRHGASPERVVVHHTGVDTSYFAPGDCDDGPRGRVLFVGRLVEKKGVVDLLEAVTRVGATGVEIPVEIIGDGPDRQQIEAFARRERIDVLMRGVQPRHEVRAAMRRAALLCAPSKRSKTGDREGFGMVLAEAQATGTPVVATRSGGIVDAVDDERTGLLVPEGDVSALSGALQRVCTDEETRRRLGGAARPWVLEHFDLVRQTARLEQRYDEWVQ